MAHEPGNACASVAPWVGIASAALLLPAASLGTPLEEFLAGADQGQCIESVAYRMIQRRGPAATVGVVTAALDALQRREQQQRALGCEGDIAAQAIAAGADPELVLEATAAGL